MEKPFTHTGDSFNFTYSDVQYTAFAECLPSSNGFRRYKLNFPNVQSIVEGSVHVIESIGGDWAIDKVMSADPIHEEFLHDIAQGFVEYIDNQKTQ